MTTMLRPITANEARAYLDGNWREKLNEIYDGVRSALEMGESSYSFNLDEAYPPFSNEIVLKRLQRDGYRLVDHSTAYVIYW